MVRAWDVSSEARPSFQQIVVDLEAALQVPGGGIQAGGASGPWSLVVLVVPGP